MFLNPNKLKVLKVSRDVGFDDLIIGDIRKFKQFKLLSELYLDFYVLVIDQTNSPGSEEVIFPNLRKLSILGQKYTNLNLNLFGKLSDSINITLQVGVCQEGIENFINDIKSNKLILNYEYQGYKFKRKGGLGLPEFIDILNPTLKENKLIAIRFSHLRDISDKINVAKKNNQQFKKAKIIDFDESKQQFKNIKTIEFINSSISIQVLFKILSYFPDVTKVRIMDCFLSNIDNQPIIPPAKGNDFLLLSDVRSFRSNRKFKSVLKNINTFIY